jgi:penicillin-binding protein 1B
MARGRRLTGRAAVESIMRWGRVPRQAVKVALAIAIAGPVLALAAYTMVQLHRFERADRARATFVYTAGQSLAPGVNVRAVDLVGTLRRLKYAETVRPPVGPGQFHRRAGAWEIYLRAPDGPGSPGPPRRVRLDLAGDRITGLIGGGKPLAATALEPEVLAGADDRVAEEYRPARLSEIPRVLVDAVIAIEDHRFRDHRGLDLRSVARAAWVNARAGRVTQGGSTITQQLIKNRLLGARRTFGRKVGEAWLAFVLEWRYSKDQLLEAYLNEVYLGQHGALAVRGVGAASRVHFRKEVHQLTLAEAALLAGMIRAPNGYAPASNPTRARARRDVVLGRMRELGKIDERAHRAALRQAIRSGAGAGDGQPAAYFADYARQELEERYGTDAISAGRGARIYTTLDMALQRFAENAILRGLDRLETRYPHLRRRPRSDRLQAALVALDPETGEIRAMVGGRDHSLTQFNRVSLARRQAGSTFKPFVYATALTKRGGAVRFTAASLLDDSPVTVRAGKRLWSPRNYDDRYEGRVSVRRALEGSLNAATVRLARTVGLIKIVGTARALGMESRLAPVPAVALGAFEVTPLQIARAYLPFANGGVRPPAPITIRAVFEGDGEGLASGETERATRVLSPAEAYLMTSLLEGVINAGTGASARALGVRGPVAGKTGTTNDGRDAWFVGYSPTLVALVWVGFDSGAPHRLSGAQAALPIWADFMRQALWAYAAPAFAIPPGITIASIDATTGMQATRFCPVSQPEAFLAGTEPRACDEHGGLTDVLTDWWGDMRDWLRR